MSESYTWGISGSSFLWLYVALCVATAVTIWLLRRSLLNTGDGLLLDDTRRALVNSLWLLALPVLALGIARVVAGVQNDRPVLYLVIGVGAVGWATLKSAERRRRATARGGELLDSERGDRTSPAQTAVGAEIPLAVALFGVGALWAADPAITSAWSIPRERAWGDGSNGGGGGGGGCGGGCGG